MITVTFEKSVLLINICTKSNRFRFFGILDVVLWTRSQISESIELSLTM